MFNPPKPAHIDLPVWNQPPGMASLIREVVVLDCNRCGWNRSVATHSVDDYTVWIAT